MSKSSDATFQSVVILGLKTALLEAESEINRLKNKLGQVEREALQYYLKCGKIELLSMKKVCKLNELKTKLHQDLKKVRLELEEQKKEIVDKENENVNLQFKVKELKSLLDIKMELLESLNIKGDKIDKNNFNDFRLDFKALLKNLKIITRNHPCYPDHQVLDDIRRLVYKTEKGKPIDISKYLLKKLKVEKKEEDEAVTGEKLIEGEHLNSNVLISNSCDLQEKKDSDSFLAFDVDKKHDDIKIKIDVDLTAVKENISPLDSRSSSILCQQYVSDEKRSSSDSIDIDMKQTPIVIDVAKIANNNSRGSKSMDKALLRPMNYVLPPLDVNNARIDIPSDSESDEMSGFCDEYIEVESPTIVEFGSSQKSATTLLTSGEPHVAQCMPNLSLENVTSVANEFSQNKISEKLPITSKIFEVEQPSETEEFSKVLVNDRSQNELLNGFRTETKISENKPPPVIEDFSQAFVNESLQAESPEKLRISSNISKAGQPPMMEDFSKASVNESSQNEVPKELRTTSEISKDERSPSIEDVSLVPKETSHQSDLNYTEYSTCNILKEMHHLKTLTTAFAGLKKFYDQNEKELADSCFKKPYTRLPSSHRANKISTAGEYLPASKLTEIPANRDNLTENHEKIVEIQEKTANEAGLPKFNENRSDENGRSCSEKPLLADMLEIRESTNNSPEIERKPLANAFNDEEVSPAIVAFECPFDGEVKQSPVQDDVFKKPDTRRSMKTILHRPFKKVPPNDGETSIFSVSPLKGNLMEVDDLKIESKSTECLNEERSNLQNCTHEGPKNTMVTERSGDSDTAKEHFGTTTRKEHFDIEEKVESKSISSLVKADVATKSSQTPKQQHILPPPKANPRSSKRPNMREKVSEAENADWKKRETRFSKRVSESNLTKQNITPKIDSQIIKVVDAEKAAKVSTVKSKIMPKPVEIVTETQNTMKNGMERRRRKGKYNEILDSLKPKRKKQSDSEIDSLSSPKMSENPLPKVRKQMNLETTKTDECTTLIGGRSSLPDVTTPVEEISIRKIVSKISKTSDVDSKIVLKSDHSTKIFTAEDCKTETISDMPSDLDDEKTETETSLRNERQFNDLPGTKSTILSSTFTAIHTLSDVVTEAEIRMVEHVDINDGENLSVGAEVEIAIEEKGKKDNVIKNEEVSDILHVINESDTETKPSDHFPAIVKDESPDERCRDVTHAAGQAELKETKELKILSKSMIPKSESATMSFGEKCTEISSEISNISDSETQTKTVVENRVEEDTPFDISSKAGYGSPVTPPTPPRVETIFEISPKHETEECENECRSNLEKMPVVDGGRKSSDDVFSIVEEMVTFNKSLFERHKELKDFIIFDPSNELPPTRTALEAVIESPSHHSPSVDAVQEFEGMEIPASEDDDDDDDSADETLIIAEDDQTNFSGPDGIEINKLNCRNVPYYPMASNGITPKSGAGFIGGRVDNAHESHVLDICQKSPTSGANAVKFQFYKETEITCTETVIKELTPFEKVWESIKCMYVPKPPIDEDLRLIECYRPVTHMAFYYKGNKKDRSWSKQNEAIPKFKRIKDMVMKFVKEVGENEFVAVENFKSSVASADAISIATVLMSFTIDCAQYETKRLKETLRLLVTLCSRLTSTYELFLDDMKAVLKNKMFTKTWKLSETNNNGMICSIIALSVFYTMLCMSSNDVKSVKDLLFDSLCSLKYRSHPIAYGVLTACPSIFNELSRNCLLTQIILFTLINHSMEWNPAMYKVSEVREMIGQYYNIKLGYKAAEDHAREAMRQFDDETWVDAIVLLCKRQQFSWSYRNVIMKYLLQIVNRWREHDFNEMILIKTVQALHNIVRCCPMRSINAPSEFSIPPEPTKVGLKHVAYNIDLIADSLGHILSSPKGSRELHEVVALALCNISHLSFERCSSILHDWKPAEGVITNKTLEKLNSCIRDTKMFPRWFQFVAPQKFANEFKMKKIKKFVKQPQDGVIRVGMSQNSLVPMKDNDRKKKKKKKKKKNKHRK